MKSGGYTERIEILPVSLLDQNRRLVAELKQVARAVRLEFGWHYLLDLSWTLAQLGSPAGMRILDAGAGTGVIQWRLAKQGAEVISVDRSSRSSLPLRFRAYVPVAGLRASDLLPSGQVLRQGLTQSLPGSLFQRLLRRASLLVQGVYYLASAAQPSAGSGVILIYNQDLADLADIPDNSLDAIVSISALEHNTLEGLEQVVHELMRILKPGAPLLATLTASPGQDSWHTPSSGWLLAEATLRRIFDLPPEAPSNYDQYDDLFAALRDCAELRQNLAGFYSRSGDNGMPWGVWDPQYQPVGVCKIKKG